MKKSILHITSDKLKANKTNICALICNSIQPASTYLKINPSQYQQLYMQSPDIAGEPFITADGYLTEADIGSVERSINGNLTGLSLITNGNLLMDAEKE
jgi:CTP synthase (UTP-ammonia lyase)